MQIEVQIEPITPREEWPVILEAEAQKRGYGLMKNAGGLVNYNSKIVVNDIFGMREWLAISAEIYKLSDHT